MSSKIFLLLTAFNIIRSELCPYELDECECELDQNNIVSLICITNNKTDDKLLEKINSNLKLFYFNYSIYSRIIISEKKFNLK